MNKFVHCSVSSDGAVRYYAAVDTNGQVWAWNDKTPEVPWKEICPAPKEAPKEVEAVKGGTSWGATDPSSTTAFTDPPVVEDHVGPTRRHK